MLCAGDKDNEEGTNMEMKMRVLSICQDMASEGGKLTPKHVGLGLAVHQTTQSKQLLHRLVHDSRCTANYWLYCKLPF